MALTNEQIKTLMSLVSATCDDCLDCDGCYDRVAEFAEAELTGRPLCEALCAVRTHLKNCPCCADEYRALLAALEELQSGG